MKGIPSADNLALANRNLHFATGGELVRANGGPSDDRFASEAQRKFRELVKAPEFPCLGAKAAFNDETYALAVYPELGSDESTAGLSNDLVEFHEYQCKLDRENRYATFIAIFREPMAIDEAQFEELLWRQLRQLHRADICDWDRNVSTDPSDPQFSFSFAGQAFYVVGMHPNSSRVARRFPWPTLVFNPHEQFERLRADGKWKRMQQAIRARDVVLQGSINPMLSDFGEESEARQYSGRAVADDWVAPFPKAHGKCPVGH